MRARVQIALCTVVIAVGLAGCGDSSGSPLIEGCMPADTTGQSVARVWNEVLLDAIRRDFPAPTVHSRNLFHVSAAMWDAWAAYDPVAAGYLVDESHTDEDVAAAREMAMSFAAYRVLLWRYSQAVGLAASFDEFVATMESLCYRIDYVDVDADTPAALGNRIAAAYIESGMSDGSLEDRRYVADGYQPVNEPMIVADPGTSMIDPNRWQPLALDVQISQNGIELPAKVQTFVGSQWGWVRGFALPEAANGLPVDPGAPPHLGDPEGDAAYKDNAVEVIRDSSVLDPADETRVDIGPGARGGNTLGTNDGTGHATNPVTGAAYVPNEVRLADFGRVIAEFWADGPSSETPPGHWNTLANAVTDVLTASGRIGTEGAGQVDPLEWDVKLYFALNGAVHDAAIAAWGSKAHYDYVRPISMIRYMGGLGQSSDPDGPSYNPEGLPLVPGLIEVVTAETSSPGERHADLADHIGEIAIRAWNGSPVEPASEAAGVGWIRAVEWVPYQRPTFVTPAFAGYVSGHSTFSRAAAEVLAGFTGDPYFPGGIFEWTVPAGTLHHEFGPSEDVTLQWATYYDAADEAGISRLYGGIHVSPDDLMGRVMGSEVGRAALAKALTYFDGTA